jgi:hypothetical protein
MADRHWLDERGKFEDTEFEDTEFEDTESRSGCTFAAGSGAPRDGRISPRGYA